MDFRNKKLNILTIISGLVLLAVSLGNVFIYNRIVGLQHLLSNRDEEAQEWRLVNVDLKNKIYKLFDNAQLMQLAPAAELVKVKNPEYLGINPANDSISFHNTNN